MNRRKFVGLTTAAVGAFWLGYFRLKFLGEAYFEHQEVGTNLIESSPQSLDPETHERLWQLFQWIGETWKLGSMADVAQRRQAFDLFVHAKSQEAPSYLGEYKNAVAIITGRAKESSKGTTDFSAPIRTLLLETTAQNKAGVRGVATTRLQHVKHYVIREFAELHMINGGYRSFGFKYYFGHPGGPLLGA